MTDGPPQSANKATDAGALATEPAPLLSVRDLVVRFRTRGGTVYALNGVTFDLAAGETLGLVGESGSGKSVTSLAIMGLLPRPAGYVERGEIFFDGVDLLKLPGRAMRELRGKSIAMVFQDPMTSLNPVLTIGRQLVEAVEAHQKLSRADARARGIELLTRVGIPNPEASLRRYPHQFSGGMRQRVMIAMALALAPVLLIADEPTTALDVTIQAQVLDLMGDLTRQMHSAMLLITHDIGVVAATTQRVAVIYAGFIVEMTSTAELFASPRHPYTVGLLRSLPQVERPGARLVPIDGMPPDQRLPVAGCPFAPRCAWRLADCWSVNPSLVPVATRHEVACHNPVWAVEVEAGRPLRPGFEPAPPPAGAEVL